MCVLSFASTLKFASVVVSDSRDVIIKIMLVLCPPCNFKEHFDECNRPETRAAESESRPELESVGVDRFTRSRSRSWSR